MRTRLPRHAALGFPLALALALALGAAHLTPAKGLLATDEIPGPATPIDAAMSEAARGLGTASAAVERGDLEAAEQALSRARAATGLADYVALVEARLLLARGRPLEAIDAARAGCSAYADSAAVGAFYELLGDALLAAGDEAEAREAWQQALRQVGSRERKQALRIAILASHSRTGTLHAAIASGEAPAMPVNGEAILPPTLEARLRSPDASLRRGDELLRSGHGAEAIIAYEAALSGELPEAERRRAELQRGHARFRLRRYAEATASFGGLLPAPEPRFWHARSLARSGNREAAIRSFEAIAAAGDPEYSNWSLYLAATLLEDSDEGVSRALAHYQRVADSDRSSSRGRDALWRLGWARYRQEDFAGARAAFHQLADRSDGLDALRPRYWEARAAERSGLRDEARLELSRLATRYPLSYYGWRASQRLGREPGSVTTPDADAPSIRIPRGRSAIAQQQTLRVALLLEAELPEFAQVELASIVRRARSLEDRTSLGRLYARTGDYHRAHRLVVDAYSEHLSHGIQPGNEALWWLSWPPAYLEILMDVFPTEAVIDPALVWAIMREESGYRPWITSSAGARGLLQIMPETGSRLARRNGLRNFEPDDLYVPKINIALGSAYLDELGRRFPGRISAAIGSYNAGPRAVSSWLRGDRAQLDDDAWVEEIPYQQTRAYVKRVLRSLLVYRSFYAQKAPNA